MSPEVEFGLLGPLLVRRGEMAVPVPAGKQRVLLAALLLHANQLVAAGELAEMLWAAGPPASVQVTLQNYVKRLRKGLGDTGHRRIRTAPHGYLISVEPGVLDLDRFETSLAAGRQAAHAGLWEAAAGRLRDALALWRGQPLADIDCDALVLREVPRLTELRLQALTARIEADLHLGLHADVIAELRQLVATYPLREHLHALLMLALYRDGQQAVALAAYQGARRVLVDELGAEPGPALRALHQRILGADPSLVLPVPVTGSTVGLAEGRSAGLPPHQAVVPRQLPAMVRHFAGRAAELAALTRLLNWPGDAPETVVISAIGGTAGVGKTALAVHWAHQVAGRFPDGQLYVNLCGYDPARPLPAADALAGFLRALGVAGQDIPPGEDERAARFRSILAGRRMLVVLDNARSAEQVRPLLPGTPACTVVVTSRDALAGLVARDGVRRLDLDLLPLDDAVWLLRELIGERADTDPDATEALAAKCCRLPLALRIAAELANSRSGAPLADLAAELGDQQKRLDLLDAGADPRTAVRTVFSWSYHHLDTATARTFRLLGLHPGTDFGQDAVAALTATTAEQAGQMLNLLARVHLIQPAGPGRHSMHDLLRAYASEVAIAQDTDAERRARLTGLFDHYLHTAATAMDILVPGEQDRRPRIPPPSTPAPPLADRAAARVWLDAQLPSLVAVAAHAAEHGWPGHATRLAATLFRYLEVAGHYPEIVAINTHARRAARRAGDRAADAEVLSRLALVDVRQGHYQQATAHLEQALALHRQTRDQAGEARTLGNLGIVGFQQGQYHQAVGHQQQALALHRQRGDQTDEATTLNNIGLIDLRQGRYQEATARLQQALALYREIRDQDGEAHALANLGQVTTRQNLYQQATGCLQQALALFRETGSPVGEAQALTNLGTLDLQQNRYQQAGGYYRQALALSREMSDQSGEAEALNGLGEVLLATCQPGAARAQHAAALGLASRIGDKYEQARAHHGLACSYQAVGAAGQAGHHWQEALTLYTALGVPEADQARAQLTLAEIQRHREQ